MRFCTVIAALVLAAPLPAAAKCEIAKYVDLPVTMAGGQPIVTAQINGRDARLILDSGAFFSTIARANAAEYGLVVRNLGPGERMSGIGGETSLGVATAKQFGIAGHTVANIQFAAGGSDTGFAGVLGQNILGLGDVEYDLPHGLVRLFRSQGCHGTDMAFWAGTKPYTLIDLAATTPDQPHTVGTVRVNGVRLRATFDTGAHGSLLTLAAARRAGVTPASPGVVAGDFAYGFGEGRVKTWRARFDSIDLGGEAIRNPTLGIAEHLVADVDMLIGIDFFLTHHIYVDNANHRMFVTYEGGPLFGLIPKGAVDSTGKALDLTDRAAEPADAAGFSQRGAVLLAANKLDAALADFDRAVALAPADAHYLVQRATARLDNRQPLLAAGDLDRAVELAPADSDAWLVRAELRLGAREPVGALADLAAADKALAPSADARLRLASLYDDADRYEPAVASYDQWLKNHPEDQGRAEAFNGRCWTRAVHDRDLDKALSDCDAALRLRPHEAAFLDSRALVRLRRGELDRALADYDAAVAAAPRQAWSLYARRLVERRLGDTARADADRAAALAINPRVADRAKRYGLDGQGVDSYVSQPESS